MPPPCASVIRYVPFASKPLKLPDSVAEFAPQVNFMPSDAANALFNVILLVKTGREFHSPAK